MIPIDIISCATTFSLDINTILPLFCDYCSTILLLVFHYIKTHNIMLSYRPVRPYNSLKVETYCQSEIKNIMYIVLTI
jgi:hypothetical protein